MNSERKFYGKLDIIIIVSILILAAVSYAAYYFFAVGNDGAYAEVIYDGNVVNTVPLSRNTTFSPDQNGNVIFNVKDNAIRFEISDCPDRLCVHTGYISHNGEVAACLPNRLAIRITGGDVSEDMPDIISR